MKLKLERKKETWPETVYFKKLRNKGVGPKFHLCCEVMHEDEGSVQVPGLPHEKQYVAFQLRDDAPSIQETDQFIRAVENVISGHTTKWSATGNAWTVELSSDGVVFEYAIMDGAPRGRVSLRTYLHALQAWKAFLADESCLARHIDLPDCQKLGVMTNGLGRVAQ